MGKASYVVVLPPVSFLPDSGGDGTDRWMFYRLAWPHVTCCLCHAGESGTGCLIPATVATVAAVAAVAALAGAGAVGLQASHDVETKDATEAKMSATDEKMPALKKRRVDEEARGTANAVGASAAAPLEALSADQRAKINASRLKAEEKKRAAKVLAQQQQAPMTAEAGVGETVAPASSGAKRARVEVVDNVGSIIM